MLLALSSAAFDTVEHEILLERLRSICTGKFFHGLRVTLRAGRSRCRLTGLSVSNLIWCVESPKGHAWPHFYSPSTWVSCFRFLKHHLPSVHTYADDTQLYLSFKPSGIFSEVEAVSVMQKCTCDVRAWMKEDQLMLNDDKTEFLIIGARQLLSKVSIQSIMVRQAVVSPVASTCNLDTWFDAHLDMGTHITKTLSITCTTYICTLY